MTHHGNWQFLTFGGGTPAYRGTVKRLTREARASGWFDSVRGLTDRDLHRRHPDFVKRHSRLLVGGSRGYGYWLWKPFIVLDALTRSSPALDGVVYCDSGCALNVNAASTQRMGEYFEMSLSGGGLGMQMHDKPEMVWTKGTLLDHLGLTQEAREEGQIIASAFVLRSSVSSIRLARDWLDVATSEDYRYLDDSGARDATPGFHFREHWLDQSIFSCLAKVAQLPTIPDETYWAPDWETSGRLYPIWPFVHAHGLALLMTASVQG